MQRLKPVALLGEKPSPSIVKPGPPSMIKKHVCAVIAAVFYGCRSLLYEDPGGNLVDGLPPVASTGEDRIGPAAPP